MKRWHWLVPFVLVMAGLAGASVARNRQETGRSEAIRSALSALRVHNRSGAEIVFALGRSVPAGTAVRDGGPASPGMGGPALHSTTRVVARAKDRSWFFYEDLAPFQEYAHAGRVVLVDVNTGRVSVSAKVAWPPTLNGRLPVFLASQTAYLSRRYRVFYRPYTGAAVGASRASSRMSSRGVRLAPAALDPTRGPQVAAVLASEHACVVRFSDTVRGGYYAFAHIAQSRAALAFRFSQLASFSGGFQSFIYSRTSGVSPTAFVADQISAHGCKDVMLYLAGGGYPGGAAVNIGMGINVSDPLHQDVSTAALRGLVGAHPGVNFELVLDAPYASAFQSLEGIRNVLLVAVPVAPGGVSFTYLPEARVGGRLIANDTNPLHVLQLTDRLAYGLDRVIASPSEVAQLEALHRAGKLPSALAYIVARAFALGAPVDFVARSGVGSPPSVHFHGFTAGPPAGGGPPPPPVVTARPDSYTVAPPGPLSVASANGVLANDSDSAGNALRVDKLNGVGGVAPLHGTSAKGAAVTLNDDGSFTYDSAGVASLHGLSHGQSVTDTFSYRATDRRGGLGTAPVTITVTGANHPPVAGSDGYAANNNVTLTQNAAGGVLANDTDPDGDTLTVDQLNGSSVLSGTSAKGAAVTVNGDGSFSYDPTGSATLQAVPRGQTTTDTFTYRANDGHGATATATVTITVTGAVNHAPVASSDGYAANNNVTLTQNAAGGVLANDTDPDGDTLTVDQLNGSSVLSGTSAKGAAVTVNGDGSFSYDPTGSATLQAVPRGQTTTDTFTYRANDGHGATATATVTLTVVGVNRPPVATPDSYAVNNDTVLSQSASGVLANDTDADGDTLVVGQLNGTGGAAPFTGTSAKGAGVSLNADGSFSYDPTGAAALHPPQLAVGSSTSDTFTYEANDGHGGTATATVTITVTAVDTAPNAPSYTVTGGAIGNTLLEVGPVASPSSEPKLTQGSDGILSHASDPDLGDSITVTAFDATSAQGGNVSVDGASGAFTYRPKAGFTGTDSFHYTVTDTHGKSATGTITVNVSNMVWYVQNNASGAHDGRSGSPFNTLASAESAAGSAAGDIIYVFKGDGTNTGQNAGITLKTNQTLLSDKYDLAVGGHTLATGTPANRSVIGNSAGAGVTLASGDTVKGFDITGTGTGAGAFAIAGGSGDASGTIADNVLHGASGAGGLTLNGTSGTWAVSDLTATGTGGAAFDASAAGTVNFTGTNSLTGTAASAFKTAGATTYSGTIATTNSTGGATNGIDASGAGGAIAFNGGTLSGTTANAILASGGNANITYSGTETNNAGHSVNVSGRTGGTITIASSISDTGTGITLTSNAGSAIVFSGTITASTGTNPAFTATGGGTVSASDTASTLTTSTGTALDVEGTTIGGSNLMFRSISADGGSHGIVLVNTGSSGHLSVSGTGTAGSGGSITAITGADAATNGCADLGSSTPAGVGVYLKSTASPSLAFMSFPGTFGNFGILGYGVSGFTLDHATMTGTYGDNVNQDEDAVHFCTLTGSASITNDTISSGAESNLRIVNASGTLNRLTMTNDTFGLNQVNGGDSVLLEADGGTFNATVQDSTFQGSRGSPFQAVPQAGASMDLVFGQPGHGNTVHNTHSNIVPFAQDLNVAAGGTLTFDINSNHFDSTAATQAQGGVFINAANSTANASGYFRNNTIGTSGVANSGSSGNDPGLDIESTGGGDLTIKVDNNQMFQWGSNGAGFLLQAGATSGNPTTFNATVTNNTIAQPGTFAVTNTAQGFQLNNGTNSGENFTTCLLFSGNVVNGSGSGGGGGDARFRQRFDTKVDMPGYTGAADGSTGSPTVASYIQGLNPTGPPSVTTVPSTAGGGGFFNTPGGAACPLPSF